jgi:DNA-binding MarR family transcriptional regulator
MAKSPARPIKTLNPAPVATTSALQLELGKKNPFDSHEQEAFLSILRTASVLSGDFEHIFKSRGLTEAMYNALRILRGSGERGAMCQELGAHLVSRVPDVTRLVDRLEKKGLAQRIRATHDRRVIYVRISKKGLEALEALDEPVRELHRSQLSHLSAKELLTLAELLAKARKADRTLPLAPTTCPK